MMIRTGATILFFATTFAWSAQADVTSLHAALSSASEQPVSTSHATGAADFTYDSATKTLKWNISYSGLSAAPTAVRLHGPAKAGETAAAELSLTGSFASPSKGSIVLSPAQAQDLLHGALYLNLETAAYKGGEIRGQIEPGQASKDG